ncbi:MAG: glycosyltransferase [Endomicrobia bacterium]|nr:glycosyltransferase [Endomicrobiia bacterium]MDW8055175.1 glycosyltransferase [Elusimicrobiota bacterium]
MKHYKFLIINSFDSTGGSTMRMRRLYDFVKRCGFEVKYIESNSELPNYDTNVISVTQKNTVIGFLIGTIKRILYMLRLKYDVLIIQKLTPFTFPLILIAKLMNKIIIVDFDDWDSLLQDSFIFRFLFSFFENLSFNLPTAYIVPTQLLMNVIIKKTKMKKPICIIPQGIDVEKFNPEKYNKDKLRELMNFSKKQKIIGFLGCFTPGGIGEFEILLDCVIELIRKNPDVYFLVIGGGRLLPKYKCKGNEKVIFTGTVKHYEVARLIAICDIMVIWMKQKRIGDYYKGTLKIIEYLAMNKSVVGYLVGDTLRRFGDFCYLVKTKQEFITVCEELLKLEKRVNTYALIKDKYSYFSGLSEFKLFLKNLCK